jgi:hypothetical protein
MTVSIFVIMLFGCSYGPISDTGIISVADGNLLVEMSANNHCLRRGDTVHLRARVRNESPSQRAFELHDKPVLDIVVAFGDYLTRWSDGKELSPDLPRLELKPGEAKTIELDWAATATASSGYANAVFIYNDRPGQYQTASVPLYIVPACPGLIGP